MDLYQPIHLFIWLFFEFYAQHNLLPGWKSLYFSLKPMDSELENIISFLVVSRKIWFRVNGSFKGKRSVATITIICQMDGAFKKRGLDWIQNDS